MPELAKQIALGVADTLVAEADFARTVEAMPQDVAVPVGADSYKVSIPIAGFPVTKEPVIACSVLISQDGGKTFSEGAGIRMDGGGAFDTDMRTLERIPLTHASCGQSLANPENPDRVLRVLFTPLKDCHAKVEVEFGGKV